jgi:hypothetical protein
MRGMSLAILLASISHGACGQPGDDAIARFKSCLQHEGAARLECFDKNSREVFQESAPAPAQSRGGNWVISETSSPVDYSPQITAAISSASAVKDAPSSFAIRCRAQRMELLVSTRGSWRPSNSFKVTYWVDNHPAVEEQWAAAPGGRGAVFRGDVTRFLRLLLEGERLSIRVSDEQGLAHQATFHVSGFEFVRQRIAAVCKWQ